MLDNTRPSTKTISQEKALSKNFVSNVFSLMFIALGITGTTAYWFASSGLVLSLSGTVGWIVMLAPLALVFVMGGAFKK